MEELKQLLLQNYNIAILYFKKYKYGILWVLSILWKHISFFSTSRLILWYCNTTVAQRHMQDISCKTRAVYRLGLQTLSTDCLLGEARVSHGPPCNKINGAHTWFIHYCWLALHVKTSCFVKMFNLKIKRCRAYVMCWYQMHTIAVEIMYSAFGVSIASLEFDLCWQQS